MLNNFFNELIEKGLVKKTKYVLMVDCQGNELYKAINAKVRDLILKSLEGQGMEIQKDKDNKCFYIFFQGYFAGCLSY
jgi:hypothetical protein